MNAHQTTVVNLRGIFSAMSSDTQIAGLLQDLQQFELAIEQDCGDKQKRLVLLLPPQSDQLRFIVHQLVNDRFLKLHTCSIGEGSDRRVLILPRDLPVKSYTAKHATYYQLSKGNLNWRAQTSNLGTSVNGKTMSNSVAGDADGEDWEDLYLENGEPVEAKTLHAIKQAVGNVKIVRPKACVPSRSAPKKLDKEQILAEELLDGYEHVSELSQFASSWTSADLMVALRPLTRNDLYEIIWVDDTHCLAVFETRAAAERILLCDAAARPCMISGLKKASTQSRTKAETSLPKGASGRSARPTTNASVARRLVTNALGLNSSAISPQTRAKAQMEHEKLEKARADKRNKKQAAEDAWDGKVS